MFRNLRLLKWVICCGRMPEILLSAVEKFLRLGKAERFVDEASMESWNCRAPDRFILDRSMEVMERKTALLLWLLL